MSEQQRDGAAETSGDQRSMRRRRPQVKFKFHKNVSLGRDHRGADSILLQVFKPMEGYTGRPKTRILFARTMEEHGERKIFNKGEWPRTALYLDDVDPLKFYNALVALQQEQAAEGGDVGGRARTIVPPAAPVMEWKNPGVVSLSKVLEDMRRRTPDVLEDVAEGCKEIQGQKKTTTEWVKEVFAALRGVVGTKDLRSAFVRIAVLASAAAYSVDSGE